VKTSEQGIKLLHGREGCVLKPYQDTKGVWTDGWGNTHGVVPNGPPISQEKADADFVRHLEVFEKSVNDCVKVPLKQHQFDALVSFAYNVGKNALAFGNSGGPSSILRALNAGDYAGAGKAFNNWMADVSVRTRRAGERDQFLGVAFEARRPV
jgi:lysozyme